MTKIFISFFLSVIFILILGKKSGSKYILKPVEKDEIVFEEYNSALIKSKWTAKGLKCKIIFAKIPKCASSTIGGIVRRIAANNYQTFHYQGIREKRTRLPGKDEHTCAVYASHFPRPKNIKAARNDILLRDALLLTFLRNPISRVLSQYYHFRVSRAGASQIDVDVIKGLGISFRRDYMTKWIADFFKRCQKTKIEDNVEICVRKIINRYDFIGIVERLDESLVVFKILNNLTFSDILRVGNSKSHGSFDDTGVKIVPTTKSPKVLEFLQNRFNLSVFVDIHLYNAINKVLDETIHFIGREIVDNQLYLYKDLLSDVNRYCQGRVFPPFSNEGTNQKALSKADCYWNDNGCGVQCMDEYVSTRKYLTKIEH